MPALPQLEGVGFRTFWAARPTTRDLARIITASSRGGGRRPRRDRRRDRVRLRPSRALRPGERPARRRGRRRSVGYSRVWWDQEVDGPRVYRQVCFVDPAHSAAAASARCCFAWNEAASARSQPSTTRREGPRGVGDDRNAAATTLVRDAGFEPITYSAEMVGRRSTTSPTIGSRKASRSGR